MKPLLNLLVVLFLTPLAALHAADAAKPKPNIIIHFIDDLGYGDIGPFGAVKQKTPHLDRMAREGMKLTSFYAAPVCSVSRAQIMTGCYGARVSVPGVYPPGAKNGLHPQEHTIADRLRPLGYATQCIGKWHLGDQPDFLPTKQGFDHYLGIPYSNDMLRNSTVDGRRVVPLVRDEQVERLLAEEDQNRIEEIYTDEAVKFIRSSKGKPFFLYFPHTAVHTPIHPGKAFQGSSQNGRFGDWVQEVDASVGRVFDTLRELQLDQNTLVIFTSDNGPWLIKGPDGGSAGPLRGGKGSTWEGGVRVPTLAWWPSKIAPGSVCDAVTGTIDVLPTCLKIAGAEVPAQPVIDGRDLSPLLFGQSKTSQREAHYYFSSYNIQAVRQGPWKLALETQKETMGKDAASDANVNPRLYNLDQEIGERTNLAAQHPDIVAKLTALAAAMDAEIGGNAPKSRRPAGVVENPVTLYPSGDKPKQRPAAKAKAQGKPGDLSTLQPGDTINAENAPQIADTPFTLTFELTTAQRDAILIAHGGASTGYALHLSGGKLIWAIRHGKTLTTAQTDYPADNQPHRITAALGPKGQLTLQLDQNASVTATGPGLISPQPKEDFCLGHDNKVPVTTYTAKGKFQGKIANLAETYPERSKEPDQKKRLPTRDAVTPGDSHTNAKPSLHAQEKSSRPNIVIVLADDMGWRDTGYHGNQVVKTPHLDQMAASGLQFDYFYPGQQMCSPGRFAIMCGRNPFRTGLHHLGAMRKEEVTIAQTLKTVGYKTGQFGKWHLGHDETTPAKMGFDQAIWKLNYFDLGASLTVGDTDEKVELKGDTSVAVMDLALEFIRKQAKQPEPFFTYVCFGSPHLPHQAADEFKKLYKDLPEKEQNYWGEVSGIDAAVGNLRAELKKLGIAENTLVWFTSDNGGYFPGSYDPSGKGKASVGCRTQGLLEWPARLKSPRKTDVVSGHVDLYPTILEITGAKMPHQPVLDGVSLLPLIDGKMTVRPQPIGFLLWGLKPRPFKFEEVDFIADVQGVWIDGKYKLVIASQSKSVELFDIYSDQENKNNLAKKLPHEVSRMTKALNDWRVAVRAGFDGKDYVKTP